MKRLKLLKKIAAYLKEQKRQRDAFNQMTCPDCGAHLVWRDCGPGNFYIACLGCRRTY